MAALYDLMMFLYHTLISISSALNRKAALRSKGLKRQKTELKNFTKAPNQMCCWMHCASLGEFEQGRPLLERIRKDMPDSVIVLTFFSPSGYEKQKNTKIADYVFYLPPDTKRKARNFVNNLQPDLVIFVKYEFWFRHLQAAKEFGAKIMLTAGIFRPNQFFFRKHPAFFRNILKLFDHFFLQNKASADLLQEAGFENYSITGDPRFDRVLSIADNSEVVEGIDAFKNNQSLLICGSTWPADENLLIKYAVRHPDIKMIIAPHEIHSEHLINIEKQVGKDCLRYSDLNENNAASAKYLIIDNIGMLSKLYRYADVCYVGGGFGVGIHNTLEAAVYGKPVIFGPNYKKFSEAVDLINEGAAFSVSNYEETERIFNALLHKNDFRNKASEKAKAYCEHKRGSTDKTFDKMIDLSAFSRQ